MKIEFEWESFRDDTDWDALFVKVGNGEWHMAQPKYGTEDKQKIIVLIYLEMLINLIVIGAISGIVLSIVLIALNYNG